MESLCCDVLNPNRLHTLDVRLPILIIAYSHSNRITAVRLKMADSFGSCELFLGSMVPEFHKKLGWREIDLKLFRQP